MVMRKVIASVVVLSLFAPSASFGQVINQDEAANGWTRPAQDREYCRQPQALPHLSPEVENQQQQRPTVMARSLRTGAVRSDAPLDSASPPPPPPPPPSSPPSAPAPMADGDSETIMVTGARIAGPAYESSSPIVTSGEGPAEAGSDIGRVMPSYPPRPGPPPRPQPRPQSGLLTAGEHDDLLNPELYSRYVNRSDLGQSVRDLPRLDTANLLTVEVKDSRGRAMPFTQVEVRCSDGNVIALKTMADGKVVFFPGMDRLSRNISIRAAGRGWRDVELSRDAGATTIGFTSRGSAEKVQKLDLMLVVDATGSMSDELRYLQAELSAITRALSRRHRDLDIRIGFSFYRDQGDQYVTRTRALGRNRDAQQNFLNQQSANGGGDYEEAMQEALIRAANQEWRSDAVKTLLLVADAPPHDRDIPTTWLAAEHLRQSRVHIVPVGASGVADSAEYVMRAMAALTQSRYSFLTDDSGVGNSHAEPSVDCYLVTRLDGLLTRIIDSQISGRRIEPERQDIVRSVGNYDAGRCVLPASFGQNG